MNLSPAAGNKPRALLILSFPKAISPLNDRWDARACSSPPAHLGRLRFPSLLAEPPYEHPVRTNLQLHAPENDLPLGAPRFPWGTAMLSGRIWVDVGVGSTTGKSYASNPQNGQQICSPRNHLSYCPATRHLYPTSEHLCARPPLRLIHKPLFF